MPSGVASSQGGRAEGDGRAGAAFVSQGCQSAATDGSLSSSSSGSGCSHGGRAGTWALGASARAAPAGSYVAQAAYRSSLLTSHHVQHIQSEVFLGAANILLLCNFHHAELGDTLTRARVLDALAVAGPVSRRFSAEGRSTSLTGLLSNVEADIPAGKVPIFFTRQHAAAWRASAKAMRGKVTTE